MAILQSMAASFKTEILNGIHAFGNSVVRASAAPDVFKLALYTSAATLDATTTAYTATGEVSSAGTNYVAGGNILTNVPPTGIGTTAITDFLDVTFTAVTLTTRGCMIYNSTQGNKAVGVFDFGSDKSATAGDLTVIFPTPDATSAVIRIV